MAEAAAKTPRYRYLKNDQPAELLDWWKALDENRAERAELRRAETPEEVLPARAFHRLCRILPSWETRDLLALATVAGVLAHVKTPGTEPLPRQLGEPKDRGGDKPAFSELRFQQLLSCREHAEFFQRLRRAVHLVGGAADVCRLADDILRWAADRLDGSAEQPSQRFRYTWAKEYFAHL